MRERPSTIAPTFGGDDDRCGMSDHIVMMITKLREEMASHRAHACVGVDMTRNVSHAF